MTKQLAHLNISYQPGGQQMEIRAVDVFQTKGGKISVAREHYDQATLMRHLCIETVTEATGPAS
jgi:hypothetical protein